MNRKLIRLLLSVLVIALLFASCGRRTDKPDGNSGEVRVSVLSGTTGFSMAPLMQRNADGSAGLPYRFTVENDASLITAGLINGSVDIAALPTNAAATLYNKTGGDVRLLTINTRGVLYLLSKGVEVNGFDDLKGKTVAVPAQNPTFIFKVLCERNGLVVGQDIFINDSFASPAELQSNVAAGNVELAVLPEPMVTVTTTANADVHISLDLTEEWNKVEPEGALVQGCIVVRSEFADRYPQAVSTFLEEYRASVEALLGDPAGASEMIVSQGIFAKAKVAEAAIPRCNICFLTGEEMKSAMTSFLSAMLEVQPASVGGKLPNDDFYLMIERQ